MMARLSAAWTTMRRVSARMFGLTLRSGAAAAARGIKKLAAHPASANPMRLAETTSIPRSVRINRPPAMVPARIAKKVPASIRPLPPISSSSARRSGRMPYFSGPKNVDWVPIRNRTAIRKPASPMKNPAAANPMIGISQNLTRRISRAFSYLSASCPANAENRKNGRMNNPAARVT